MGAPDTRQPVPGLYRERIGSPWLDCEIVGRHWPSGAYVLREVGKVWPGIWLGYPDQVRVPGPILELREPFGNDTRAA